MHAYTVTGAMRVLCRTTRKWGLYIAGWDLMNLPYTEVLKAAPYLNPKDDNHEQILADGCGILLFDTEDAMLNHFELTVGDDGPTQLNPYNGPARVYALTCNPRGELMNENT